MSGRFWTRVRGRYIRTTARVFSKRPLTFVSKFPLVSFTFDDFPRSALLVGGSVLEKAGARGTYYASLGLMGGQAPTGTMFLEEDLKGAIERGHELGCHTYAHCDAWETETKTFADSIIKNRQVLNTLLPGATLKTLSYPINPPRVRTKRTMAGHFVCCRGGGQTFNAGDADLNCLSAYFLEKSRDNPEAVMNLIDQNAKARGWLIFATHDISNDPTPWGCAPGFFEMIVQYALKSGARVLPVFQAWEVLAATSSDRGGGQLHGAQNSSQG
jgi:hypothetical protein